MIVDIQYYTTAPHLQIKNMIKLLQMISDTLDNTRFIPSEIKGHIKNFNQFRRIKIQITKDHVNAIEGTGDANNLRIAVLNEQDVLVGHYVPDWHEFIKRDSDSIKDTSDSKSNCKS